MFEAAVAGGIPIIRPLKQCLAGNHLSEIVGIVNGTTNFILTKMTQENMEFAEALALATKLGYAEADPTADIQGYDAGRKMAIMASIAFNSRVTFENVATEGITRISSKDIRYARDLGCVIKLLGVARNTDTGIEVSVQPMLVSEKHPLASVNDSFNAVFVHGDAVDDAMFYGKMCIRDRDKGEADLLPTTIDSYTRQNRYEEAEVGIKESIHTQKSMLNGFPAVNHGVYGCRQIIENLDTPVQVRHGTPDARLLTEIC